MTDKTNQKDIENKNKKDIGKKPSTELKDDDLNKVVGGGSGVKPGTPKIVG